MHDPVRLGVALVETALAGCQAEHALDPCNIARSVYVDTTGVSSYDFDLSVEQQQRLLENGREAAEKFLAGWDYERWLRSCRGVPSA